MKRKYFLIGIFFIALTGIIAYLKPSQLKPPLQPIFLQIQKQQEQEKKRSISTKKNEAQINISVKTLQESIATINNSMPSNQQLRQLGQEQLHHMPPIMHKLSRELGKIKQLLHDHPDDANIISKATHFYRSCVPQEDWPSDVRALCLANLHQLTGESMHSAPKKIRRLAEQVLEIP